MARENQPLPIQQLEQRKAKLTNLINQRESLVTRIGSGKVKVGSSSENTIKVGKARKMVKDSLPRLRGSLQEVSQETSILDQAQEHLSTIALREKQLTIMREMLAEGNLSKEEIEVHQEEFEALRSLPEQNPALKRGLERLVREKTASTMPPPYRS